MATHTITRERNLTTRKLNITMEEAESNPVSFNLKKTTITRFNRTTRERFRLTLLRNVSKTTRSLVKTWLTALTI